MKTEAEATSHTPAEKKQMTKIIRVTRLVCLISLILFMLGALTIFFMDQWIALSFQSRVYTNLKEVPYRPVALVLGTSATNHGRVNLYYKYRLEAAADLYHAGKVDALLLSGDNGRHEYNEPEDMKQDLIELGVPAEHITLDHAGFRTLDSIVRAHQIFQQSTYTVISQPFHCRRALFLSDHQKSEPITIAFAAKDVRGKSNARIRVRETLARVKAFLDLYILNTKPKYLGKTETVTLRVQVQ